MLYATRSAAARAAIKAGHKQFRTRWMATGWKFSPMTLHELPIPYADGKDFVAWTEVASIDEGRTPGYQGVLVVSCFKDELPDDIPTDLLVEPQTPELWDGSKGSTTGATKATSAGPRAKSDVESPTKLVWRMADEMVGADRKDVIAACVAAGVNKSTAQTQYYKWSKARSK